MANPEERPDDRPELPTRVPFAGPHPGTVERDNWSHVSHQPRNGQGKIRAFTLHEGRLLEDA